jgi:hypothetical protein
LKHLLFGVTQSKNVTTDATIVAVVVALIASVVKHTAKVLANATAKVVEKIRPSAVLCLRLAAFFTNPAHGAYLREEELTEQLIPGTIVGDCHF